MTDYGVTPAGFVLKPVSQIVTETNGDILSNINPALDLDAEEPLGQLVAIVAEKLYEVWALAQVAYNAFNRGDAEGPALDNIGAIIAVKREAQTASTVYCSAVFSASGTYGANSLVAYLPSNPTIQFANLNPIIVPTMSPVVSPSNPYTVKGALWQAIAPGPDPGNALIAANAAASIPFGSLTGVQPVSGWVSVVDTAPPTVGAFVQSDAAYRSSQIAALSAPGACTLDACVADIVEGLAAAPTPVSGVTVSMYENTTLATDANGLPAKSFMAVVFDGLAPNTTQDDPIIAQAIWNNKPAGIGSYGTTSALAYDAEGNPQTVWFSRSTQVPIYLVVSVAIAPSASPAAVQALVAEAIVDAAQGQPYTLAGSTVQPPSGSPTTLVPGQDVVAMAFRAIAQGQSGVVDVPSFTLGTSPGPTGMTNVKIGPTQIGVIAGVSVAASVFQP